MLSTFDIFDVNTECIGLLNSAFHFVHPGVNQFPSKLMWEFPKDFSSFGDVVASAPCLSQKETHLPQITPFTRVCQEQSLNSLVRILT